MHRRQGALTRFKLPAEIFDHIIDDLATHVPALRACSLTSREWRVRSQHHLLSSIYIPDVTQMASLSTFVAMFPFRAEGIHGVRISISALCGGAILQLPLLVNADTLTLSGATSAIHNELRLAPLPIIFPSISSLTVKNWPLNDLYAGFLTGMLSRFALLRTLDLHCGPTICRSGYTIADNYAPPSNAPLPLESLSLNVSHSDLCTWIAARSWLDVTALRRFELDITRPVIVPNELCDLLAQVLPTVHELVLRAEHPPTYVDMLFAMTRRVLRPGPNLKTLSMFLGEHDLHPMALEELLQLARVLAHPVCTALTIDVLLAAPDIPHEWDPLTWDHGWTAVAEELELESVPCASLTLVVPKLIVDGHQEAFAKVEQMLGAHGVTIRGSV